MKSSQRFESADEHVTMSDLVAASGSSSISQWRYLAKPRTRIASRWPAGKRASRASRSRVSEVSSLSGLAIPQPDLGIVGVVIIELGLLAAIPDPCGSDTLRLRHSDRTQLFLQKFYSPSEYYTDGGRCQPNKNPPPFDERFSLCTIARLVSYVRKERHESRSLDSRSQLSL